MFPVNLPRELEFTKMSESQQPAESALEMLSTQLTCSVCLDTYRDPKVLPCLHVFCMTCLERLVSRDGASLSCPNCRKETQLFREGVSGLQSAFYINHLFVVRDTLEKAKDAKLECQHCRKEKATGYCRNCREFYCEPCIEVHKKWKGFMSHTITTTEEIQAEALNFVSAKTAMACTTHPDKPVEIYCETCEELICQYCVVKTHRDHEYDLVRDCFPKHRDAITASLQPVNRQLDVVKQAIAEMDARSMRLAEQVLSAKQGIEGQIDQLHIALESRKGELIRETDQLAEQASKSLHAQRHLYELTQTQLHGCLEYVEESLRTGSQEEILSIEKQVIETVKLMASEFNPGDYQPEPEQTVRCSQNHQKLAEACLGFGEVFITTAGAPVVEEKLRPSTTDTSIHDIQAQTIETVKEPQGLAITQTGELLVADLSANCVRVLDRSGNKLRSIGKKELCCPHGVAVCSESTVLVAAEHCVKRFTLKGRLIASAGTKGNGELQFDTPIAVACSPTNKKVYVCDTWNHRIQVLNSDMTFSSTFGSKGTDPGQFSCPTGIAIDKKGNVFVADYNSNRIQVFSPDGQPLREITQQKPGGERLRGPVSVCLDSNEFVYVLESNAYRVSVFNKEGDFVRTFRKREKAGEFNNLHSIAVDRTGYVYLSDTDNHKIEVFH